MPILMVDSIDRYHATLIGGALGDAMGRVVEFDRRPHGGRDHVVLRDGARVTDDTQLSLAVARAIETIRCTRPQDFDRLRSKLTQEFRSWLHHPDTPHGSPGLTCMKACSALDRGTPWELATQLESKGNGGVMRAHPMAFISDQGFRQRAAVLQSAMTHGHPTATAAAQAWVHVVHAASNGAPADSWFKEAHSAQLLTSSPA